MPRRRATVVWLLAAALAGAACSREPATYANAPVILVSIDTLRADRLPLYGYGRGSTPALDALGRDGIVFENVYSHCPLTLPAHASMLTGLLPPRHGVRDNSGFTLQPTVATLATRFARAGRPAGAAVSGFVLRRATGIAQGFERYDDEIVTDAAAEDVGEQQRDGAAAVSSLVAWIEARRDSRFFAFLHLYEPHTPYAPPPPFRERFAASPYDGEVAYADALVGRFFDRLRTLAVLERAIVAVTSDHGEGLGEHGEQEHGFFLYRATLRVPLILRLPGRARAGTRVGATVAQVDLAPTLLDFAGLEAHGLDGVSLRAAIAGRAAARPVYSETFFPRYHFGWSELFAVSEDRYRYVRAPRPELFDLTADPREARNLVAERGQTVAAMEAWLTSSLGAGDVAMPSPVDAETRERLQALGYVGSGGGEPAQGTTRADPKDKVAAYEAFRRAIALRRQGRDAEAAAELKNVVADDAGMLDVWETLGLTLVRLGREGEARAALGESIRLDPKRPSSHIALARLDALAGRPQAAEAHATAAAAADPAAGHELLAELLLARNQPGPAADHARRSVAADPGRVTSHFVLAVVARRAGRCEEALEEYRRAADAQRQQRRLVVRDLHAGMADCLARLGREAEAEREFLAEIEAIPHTREGRVGLSMLYRSESRDGDARRVLEGVVTAHPQPGPDEYWTVLHGFQVLGDSDAAHQWAVRARRLFPGDPRFR